MAVTVRLALKQISENLKVQPVYLRVDDTMAAKFGTKFEHVSKLFTMLRIMAPTILTDIVLSVSRCAYRCGKSTGFLI